MERKKCSGCGACFALCPKKAIEKRMTDDGWFVYTINEQNCVHCGLCEAVCPSHSDVSSLTDFNTCEKYGAYSLDGASVAKSASGGAAYEMGKYAIENGYCVIGTVYDYTQNKAVWEIANDLQTLERFRGSKYLQADVDPVFDRVLHTAGKYLVIGTPCQIYGMRKAVALSHNKCASEFVFVDFVCHGTPSYVLWDAYLRECAEGAVKKVNFKDKTYGWHKSALRVESENKTTLEKRTKSSFFLAFDDYYFFGEQCYECELNNGRGVSDIRIGDCWGKQYAKNQAGVSRILIATEKGKELFEGIRQRMVCEPIEMFLPANNKRDSKRFQVLRRRAIEDAKASADLKGVVCRYRKTLPLKHRVFAKMRSNKLFMAAYEVRNKITRR